MKLASYPLIMQQDDGVTPPKPYKFDVTPFYHHHHQADYYGGEANRIHNQYYSNVQQPVRTNGNIVCTSATVQLSTTQTSDNETEQLDTVNEIHIVAFLICIFRLVKATTHIVINERHSVANS
jgi:membrane-associated HD superfamily phosphohydrolase